MAAWSVGVWVRLSSGQFFGEKESSVFWALDSFLLPQSWSCFQRSLGGLLHTFFSTCERPTVAQGCVYPETAAERQRSSWPASGPPPLQDLPGLPTPPQPPSLSVTDCESSPAPGYVSQEFVDSNLLLLGGEVEMGSGWFFFQILFYQLLLVFVLGHLSI